MENLGGCIAVAAHHPIASRRWTGGSGTAACSLRSLPPSARRHRASPHCLTTAPALLAAASFLLFFSPVHPGQSPSVGGSYYSN